MPWTTRQPPTADALDRNGQPAVRTAWKRLLGTFTALLVVIIHASSAHSVPLYDGALNTTPDTQGWLYLTDPIFGASATQTASGGVTTLDTSPVEAAMAGYFSSLHPAVPPLDRTTGFTVSFDVQLLAEHHSSSSRAGFSVIVVSQDLTALELGFWENEIWGQADTPMFTHAEGSLFDTTADLIHYDLSVLGGDYTLLANHAVILEGALRNYSSFGAPYAIPNFLFFGDDTSSASAITNLASITTDPTAIVLAHTPEPGTWILIGTGLVALLVYNWRKRYQATTTFC